ncbi:MAG: peptidylprolyl isomerase [Actinomycetes bacterium]
MIVLTPRRLISLTVLALTVMTTATSCSSVTKDAARFNDESLSNSEFDDLLIGYAAAVPEAFLASGNIDISIAQGIVQNWISTEAVVTALDQVGIKITDEDLRSALTSLQVQTGFSDAPKVVQDFYVLASASQAVANREFAMSSDDLKSLYEGQGSKSGAVCLRAILVKTQEEIDAVTSRLDAGEDFAAIAQEVSTDSSATNGGALQDQTSGSGCLEQSTFESQVTPEFLTALADAKIGQATASFEIPTVGWVVLLVRPFDEVADDVANLISGNGAVAAGRAVLQDAKIWVSPEYGRWDAETLGVVAVD